MAKKRSPQERAVEVFSEDEYLKQILEGMPADKRDTILAKVGGYMLKQDEFNRLANETREEREAVAAHKQNLDLWWEENRALITEADQYKAELEKLKGQGNRPEGDDPPASPPPGLTKEQLEHLLEQKLAERQNLIESRGLTSIAALNKLSFEHFQKFGEPLDLNALYAAASKHKLPPDVAYYEVFAKEQLEDAEKKKKEEEFELLKAKAREEVLREVSANPHLPYAAPSTEPGVLSGLNDKNKYGVQAAVEEYVRMQHPGPAR